MINLGTVGTSAICDASLKGVALCAKFKHTAVYSRTEERAKVFAKKHGCYNTFTSLSAMAESDVIDAVYIASPNVFHASQCELFITHGKHVICEKSIVTSADEYRRLKALADSYGVIYMEAIMPPHSPCHSDVINALKSIGKPLVARIDFSKRSSRMDAFLKGEHVNIFDLSLCAGTLMDLGIYCVWATVDFFGKPESIVANAHFFGNGADKSGTAIFNYGDFSAVLTYSKAGESKIGSEIICENGTLKIGGISQYTDITLTKNGKTEVIVGTPSRTEVMCGEAVTFARYIEGSVESIAEYAKISDLTATVHDCMDKIKKSAGITYPAQIKE